MGFNNLNKMAVGLIQFWSFFKEKLNIKEDEKGFSKTLNFLVEKYCNNNFDSYLKLYSLFCDYINSENDQMKETSLNELEKHLNQMKKILAGAK